ncbi:LLM class flavin-dependent oxidoreductase [Streptomyces violaceusniger]|uniref:Luciferase-like domain-containing protein n=1 Tax=Streptomyces violaceusniger TaxID=68280 RepID=A0A4D4LIH5_STRVO|nr:hypothetical protein SVIO_108870 [Streptomyces violaceusniger]
MEKLPPRDVRYAMADEYVDVVRQLFASWDADAVVLDREKGIYADHTKVRPIHFKGEHFSVRGPLNTVPSPQLRAAFVQAGASPRGRRFAARNADSVIAIANGPSGIHPPSRRSTSLSSTSTNPCRTGWKPTENRVRWTNCSSGAAAKPCGSWSSTGLGDWSPRWS